MWAFGMAKIVKKLWGIERWLHNENDYCMKILELNPGFQSSLHYHKHKRETFLVTQGNVHLEVISGYRVGQERKKLVVLGPGRFYTLDPYVPHRFTAIGDRAMIVEASTRHDDRDVFRLEESRKLGS